MKYVGIIIEFIGLFLFAFLYYRLLGLRTFSSKKDKKTNKKKLIKVKPKDLKSVPEIRILVLLFKLDENKVDYIKLAKQLSFAISFNLALVVIISTELFDSLLLKIFIGFAALLFTMYVTYYIIGTIYKRKEVKSNVQS